MQNLLQQANKQSIIIVSSAPPSGLQTILNQGANSSSQQQQANAAISNLQGGGQALSLSGLNAQQLAQILQAYGVIGGSGNSVQNQLNQIKQLCSNQQYAEIQFPNGQQPQQPPQQPSNFVNPQVAQPPSTNIIVVSTSNGQQAQNPSYLGQSLQQQIQQLQAQNQFMQQQILANAVQQPEGQAPSFQAGDPNLLKYGGGPMEKEDKIQNSLSRQQQLIQERLHQLNRGGEDNNLFQKINLAEDSANGSRSQDPSRREFKVSRHPNGKGRPDLPAHPSMGSQSVDRTAQDRPVVQADQQQNVLAQLQQIFNQNQNQAANSGMYNTANPSLVQSSAGQSQYQGVLSHLAPPSDVASMQSVLGNPRGQGKSVNFENKGGSGLQNPWAYQSNSQNYRHSSAQPASQQQQPSSNFSKKKPKNQQASQGWNEQASVSKPLPTKAQTSKKQKESTDDGLPVSKKKKKSSNLNPAGVLEGASQTQPNNRQHFQSATQRQKGAFADSQQVVNFNSSNPPTTQNLQSPHNIRPSEAAGLMTSDFKQIIMKNSGQVTSVALNKQKKPKKGVKQSVVDQEEAKLAVPANLSAAIKNQTTSIRLSPNNASATRAGQVKDPLGGKAADQTQKPGDLIGKKENALLIPPAQQAAAGGLTAKEKKRLKMEKEKERERELFEKNFKSSDLYICKMALNVQKSFITKPNAIVVYNQFRLVKLDITTSSVFQPSAVPQSVIPSVGAPQKPLLITPEELHDFYNHSHVKIFANVGRALEVVEEPKFVFKKDQEHFDPKAHSIQERKIREEVEKQLELKRKMSQQEELAKNPIIFPSGNIKDTTIFFNSRFESGNLREVEKLNEFEYNLFVNFDFNSTTHSQWYFFSVRNIGKGKQYKFNIMNLQKDESCYQIGMKPFVYSTKRNRDLGTNQWRRGCDNVCYYKNKLRTKARECAPDYEFDEDSIPCYEYEDEASQMVSLNTLSFCYEFDYENDITYFSYFQPYTLSDLDDYLFHISKKYEADYLQTIYKQEKLCTTLGGNNCYVLTITDNVREDDISIDPKRKSEAPSNQGGAQSSRATHRVAPSTDDPEGTPSAGQSQSAKPMAESSTDCHQPPERETRSSHQKQTIFLTGRVHPGEANASFMIQGAIDFLLQKNNKEAKALRETFIFKIIPMLNPDGVVNGNYRCNYIGADLNRRWPNPSKLLHPTIYYTKKLLRLCHQDNQVLLFCDFHGHTRKRNVFMYGCVSPQTEINQHKNNNLIRIVPYLLDQKNRLFSFADCKFANEKEKESTGRLVMFKEFGILNSYTIESTFYSYYNPKMGQKKKVNVEDDQQIKAEELLQIGNDFCETLMVIINSKILKRKFIIDTATPLGSLLPGQGGNPLTQFLLNQQNDVSQQKQTGQQKGNRRDGDQSSSNVSNMGKSSFLSGSNQQYQIGLSAPQGSFNSKVGDIASSNFNSRIGQPMGNVGAMKGNSPDKKRIVKRSETFQNGHGLEQAKSKSQTRKAEGSTQLAQPSPSKRQSAQTNTKPSDIQLLQAINDNINLQEISGGNSQVAAQIQRRQSQVHKTQGDQHPPLSPEKKKRKKADDAESSMQTLQFYGKGANKKNYSSKDGFVSAIQRDDYMTPQQRVENDKQLMSEKTIDQATKTDMSLSRADQEQPSTGQSQAQGSSSAGGSVDPKLVEAAQHQARIYSRKPQLEKENEGNKVESFGATQHIGAYQTPNSQGLQSANPSKRNMPHSAHHTPLSKEDFRAHGGNHSDTSANPPHERIGAIEKRQKLFSDTDYQTSGLLLVEKQKSSSASRVREADLPQNPINDINFKIEYDMNHIRGSNIKTTKLKQPVLDRGGVASEQPTGYKISAKGTQRIISSGQPLNSIITSNQNPLFFNQAADNQFIDQSTPIFTQMNEQKGLAMREQAKEYRRRNSRNTEQILMGDPSNIEPAEDPLYGSYKWKSHSIQEVPTSGRKDGDQMVGPEQQNIIDQYINKQQEEAPKGNCSVGTPQILRKRESQEDDARPLKKGYTQKYGNREQLDHVAKAGRKSASKPQEKSTDPEAKSMIKNQSGMNLSSTKKRAKPQPEQLSSFFSQPQQPKKMPQVLKGNIPISNSQKQARDKIVPNKLMMAHSSFSNKKGEEQSFPQNLLQRQQMIQIIQSQPQPAASQGQPTPAQFMQLREQKSKSSLSVMSYNNGQTASAQKPSVQGSGTLATPLKNLSAMNPQSNMYFQATPQQQAPPSGISSSGGAKSNKSSQQIKQQLYKQSILNSAPSNSVKQQEVANDYFHQTTQIQNYCLPPGQDQPIPASLNNKHQVVMEMQQRILQSRKQQHQAPPAEASPSGQHIMNARQSYQSGQGDYQKNSAAQNYKRNYIARNGGGTGIIVAKQNNLGATDTGQPYPYQKSYLDIPEKSPLRKPGSTGSGGHGGLGANSSQNNSSATGQSTWGTSVLPEINDSAGGSRLNQNLTEGGQPRPNSQSKKDQAIATGNQIIQQQFPHRNIMMNVGQNVALSSNNVPYSQPNTQHNTLGGSAIGIVSQLQQEQQFGTKLNLTSQTGNLSIHSKLGSQPMSESKKESFHQTPLSGPLGGLHTHGNSVSGNPTPSSAQPLQKSQKHLVHMKNSQSEDRHHDQVHLEQRDGDLE